MKILNLVMGLLLSLVLLPFALAEEEKSLIGFDFSASRQHQEFEFMDADITSVSVMPYWQVGDWNFSAIIPAYRIEGDYFVNGNKPRLARRCNYLRQASEEEIRDFLNGPLPLVKLGILAYCRNLPDGDKALDEIHSGIGDASIGARYTIALDDAGVWWVGTSLDYKFDNGDVDTGLGNGSTDATLAFTLGSLTDTWQTQFSVSYVAVNATDTPIDIQNYAMATANIGYAINKWFTLGAEYNFEQPYVVGDEDVKTITGYMDVTFNKAWSLHLYTSDYLGAEGYSIPTNEFGASLQYSF